MSKISVIVPVCNSRDYVITCIDSLLGQTLEDIDIIIVDDHGSDDAVQAVRNLAEGYSGKKRFLFAETSANSGPGVARNVGLILAEGEYVAFVDSDDWVERDFCEILYKAASRKNADIACCHYKSDNLRDSSSAEVSYPSITSGDFSMKKRRAFLLAKELPVATTFLCRRAFLMEKAIRFPETRCGEDGAFVAMCLLAAKRIATVERPLYHYVGRPRSLSVKIDPNKYLQQSASFDEVLSFARRQDLYEPFKNETDFLFIREGFLKACRIYVGNVLKPESAVLSELCSLLKDRVPEYEENPYLKKKLIMRLQVKNLFKHPKAAMRYLKRKVRRAS